MASPALMRAPTPTSNEAGPVGRTWARLVAHWVYLASALLGDDWAGRRIRVTLLRWAGSRIGAGSALHGGTYLTRPAHLSLGARCFVNRGCYFDLDAPIRVGDDVVIGHRVTLVTTVHEVGDSSRRAKEWGAKSIEIGDGAWLGANSTVLPGVVIGRGTIVAAGAVVTKSTPPDVMVAGVPARVIRPLADG